MSDQEQKPSQSFEELPINERLKLLNGAVSTREAKLEGDAPLAADERRTLLVELSSLVEEREVTFLEKEGLSREQAKRCAGHAIGEGMRLSQLVIGTSIGEASYIVAIADVPKPTFHDVQEFTSINDLRTFRPFPLDSLMVIQPVDPS